MKAGRESNSRFLVRSQVHSPLYYQPSCEAPRRIELRYAGSKPAVLAVRLKGYMGDIRDLNPYRQRHNLPCYLYTNATVAHVRVALTTPSFQGTADTPPDMRYVKTYLVATILDFM